MITNDAFSRKSYPELASSRRLARTARAARFATLALAAAAAAAAAVGCSDGAPAGASAASTPRDGAVTFTSVQADFDGDGALDVAVGVTGDDVRAEAGAGCVLVLFGGATGAGSPPLVLAPPETIGGAAAARFGAQLVAGDFDADGRDDFAVLIPNGPNTTRFEGRALAYTAKGKAVREPFEVKVAMPATSAELPASTTSTTSLLARTPDPIPFAEMTPLQKHSAFFDYDSDGWITLAETYRGCRELGIGPISSASLALAINAALAWPTARSLIPTLSIRIRNVDRGKHGSDTDIYDTKGRFVPERFEHFWKIWDKNHDGFLDPAEFAARLYEERDVWDFVGQIASTAEFGLLFLIADENGKISKETMRRSYDGTLFYEIAARGGARTPLP